MDPSHRGRSTHYLKQAAQRNRPCWLRASTIKCQRGWRVGKQNALKFAAGKILQAEGGCLGSYTQAEGSGPVCRATIRAAANRIASMSQVCFVHLNGQKSGADCLLLTGFKVHPARALVEVVDRRHEAMLEPEPRWLVFGPDFALATAKAIERNVAECGQESRLLQGSQFASVQRLVETQSAHIAAEFRFESSAGTTGQFIKKVLAI